MLVAGQGAGGLLPYGALERGAFQSFFPPRPMLLLPNATRSSSWRVKPRRIPSWHGPSRLLPSASVVDSWNASRSTFLKFSEYASTDWICTIRHGRVDPATIFPLQDP